MIDGAWKTVLGASVAMISLSASLPAMAQDADDIVVTARRTEERLQDVPISITVYNKDQLQQRNVAVASDLSVYTPSLAVNTRYGPDKATFALRGFNQDASTAPTVGVYFADVVGIRAQGGTAGGNTVGAGSFTDLQNVQILKGPQGTLFGRNTTGGAILLVPQKPTDNLEGYVEGTYGNYDQKRVQAALNIPLAETFKVRLSLDRNKRDGYMKNHSGIGPKDYNDMDYVYGRLSIVADLTPNLENYTIATYSKSDTNGYATRYEQCNPNGPNLIALLGRAACAQIERGKARGDGPLDVDVNNPDPNINIEIWQAINTTTWQASDNITIKNIMSYGEYREQSAFSLNSDNLFIPGTTRRFQNIRLAKQPGYNAAAESTATEELQLQGRSSNGKFNYVVGGYLEFSRPIGYNQQRTGIYGNCVDPGTLDCVGGLPIISLNANAAGKLGLPAVATTLPGAIVNESRTKMNFDNHGIFAQGTYNFSDQLALTMGGRWTFDKISGYSETSRYTFATLPNGTTIPFSHLCNDNLNHPAPGAANATATNAVDLLTNGGNKAACGTKSVNKSNKPTWLIDLDFKPTADTLLYAKWSRGYRQGTLNFTNPGFETSLPEKLEAYELGAKLTFRGSTPGYFNVAGFYNDFSNQQVFAALIAKPESGLAGGAGIINAGKTSIKGVEVDTGVTIASLFRASVGYTYLDSELKKLVAPVLSPDSPFAQVVPRGVIGGPLTFTPKHRLTVSGNLLIPVDENLGKIDLGVIYTYSASQLVDGNQPISYVGQGANGPFKQVSVPGYSLLNLNASWSNIGGSGVDLVGFATNITNKHYRVASGGSYESSGFLDFAYGPPRMYGVRIRYNFGS